MSGDSEKFDFLGEVKRLGGLEFTPQTPEAWGELARVLKRLAKSPNHARRIVGRFLEPGAQRQCPTPGELAMMAKSVPADPKLDRPELAEPCDDCRDFGGNWRLKIGAGGGLERCECARGLKLRAMDEARNGAGPERKAGHLEKPSADDWQQRAAGDR